MDIKASWTKRLKRSNKGKRREKEQKETEQVKKRKCEDSNMDIKDVGKGKQKLVEVSNEDVEIGKEEEIDKQLSIDEEMEMLYLEDEIIEEEEESD